VLILPHIARPGRLGFALNCFDDFGGHPVGAHLIGDFEAEVRQSVQRHSFPIQFLRAGLLDCQGSGNGMTGYSPPTELKWSIQKNRQAFVFVD
jgi:hypothetical protein